MSNNIHEKAGSTEYLNGHSVQKPFREIFQKVFLPPSLGGEEFHAPEGLKSFVLNCSSEHIPPIHKGYCFRKDLLRGVLTFLRKPHGDALFLTGPTGSGKTSLITEIFGRLNWPLQQVTLNERFEFQQLRGCWLYKTKDGARAPEMVFQDGPLTTAMRLGHGLLLNEADIAPAGEMAALNDVIEGRPLVIPETGEVVHPHPLFRLIVTANSKGAGDDTGLYAGIQQQNIAAMDRYRVLEIGYPEPRVEESLIAGILSETLDEEQAKSFAHNMVDLANRVRCQFVGLIGPEGTFSVPISTRVLTRWAYLMQDYFLSKNPARAALNEALLNRCNPADKESINNLALSIFGKSWDNPED